MKQVEQGEAQAKEAAVDHSAADNVQGSGRNERVGEQPRRRCVRAPRAIAVFIAAGIDESQLEEWWSQFGSIEGWAWLLLAADGEQAARWSHRLLLGGTSQVYEVHKPVRFEADSAYVMPSCLGSSVLTPAAQGSEAGAGLSRVAARGGRSHAPEPDVSEATEACLVQLSELYGERLIGILPAAFQLEVYPGLQAIKNRGGLLAVEQVEGEGKRNLHQLLARVPVDLVLTAPQLIGAIKRFIDAKPKLWATRPVARADVKEQRLLEVLELVHQRTEQDFRPLRPAVSWRRVRSRWRELGLRDIQEYLCLLRREPAEAECLADRLHARVRRFFQDHELFRSLEQQVLPELFQLSRGIRVWCVGCAGGEEAYSLAMLLHEARERWGQREELRVFATDLHPKSLARAREGVFGEESQRDVDARRLRRYFERDAAGYRVRPELRELVVFARHDLLVDAPLPRMDLILCRNLLAFMQLEWKRHALGALAQSLRSSGYLVLGASERLECGEVWLTEDAEQRIFRKNREHAPRALPPHQRESTQSLAALHIELREMLTPPSVLIDPEDRVVHVSDEAGRYLIHPAGEPTSNVARWLPWPLRAEIKAALIEARRQRGVVRISPARVTAHGRSFQLGVELRQADEHRAGFVLVTFHERTQGEYELPDESGPERASLDVQRREWDVERQLAARRLAVLLDRHEASQEALRARNEELYSVNEELRVMLQDLEASRRELCAANSELDAMNREYRSKLIELERFSSDLTDLLEATDIATLFLDRELRILRFTSKVTELFNLKVSDRGRPLRDLTHRLGYPELAEDARGGLKRHGRVEREVQSESGEWYLTRLLPYRTPRESTGGVAVTFIEITARKRAEDELRQAKDYAEHIIHALPQPLVVLTSEFLVLSANGAFYDYTGLAREQTLGRPLYGLREGEWNVAELRTLLEEVLLNGDSFTGYQLEREVRGQRRSVVSINARRLGPLPLILMGLTDITARHDVERALRRSEAKYRALSELSPQAIVVVFQGRYGYANQRAAALLGVEHPHELIGCAVLEVPQRRLGEFIQGHVERVLNASERLASRHRFGSRLDRGDIWVELVAGVIEWDGRRAVQLVAHETGPPGPALA